MKEKERERESDWQGSVCYTDISTPRQTAVLVNGESSVFGTRTRSADKRKSDKGKSIH